MSGANLKRENISPQVIYMSENDPNPCHIRNAEYRYVYTNSAMVALLDLPDSFNISGKLLSETPHWSSVFADEIHQYDEMVMVKNSPISLLITCVFGRENTIQPYIFYVSPFFDNTGNVVGTMTKASPCKFFSLMQYIDGKSPVTLIKNKQFIRFIERDLEIIFFTYHGLTSKETARRLEISHRTVENRLCIMYQKAEVHNIHQFREFCRDIDLEYHIPSSFMKQK